MCRPFAELDEKRNRWEMEFKQELSLKNAPPTSARNKQNFTYFKSRIRIKTTLTKYLDNFTSQS